MHLHVDVLRLSLWTFVLVTLGDFVTKSSVSLAESCQCQDFGPCKNSLPGPGPLNTSAQIDVGDFRFVGDQVSIHVCMNYTTSFLWFKLVDKVSVPYPSEEDIKRVQCCDRNQTLIINSAKKTDEGIYTFNASNGTALVVGSFTVNIIPCTNAEPKLITSEQPIQHVYLGSSKTLKCAGDFGHCEHKEVGLVQWYWQDDQGIETWVNENVNPNWRLEGGNIDSNLTIVQVSDEDFKGKFICVLVTTREQPWFNYSIQFLPPAPVNTLTEKIVGIVLGSLIALALGCFLIWWYHGDRIKFMCRRQPGRGEYKHDAVIVHGEDHQQLLHDVIRPQLEEQGYNVKEETAMPGRPEVLEQATAILESYCVILSYSSAELCEGRGLFLTKIAKLSHNHNSVVVIKPHNDNSSARVNCTQSRVKEQDSCQMDNGIPVQVEETEGLQVQGGQQPSVNPESVWKHKAFKSLQILTWPQSLEALNSSISNNRSVALGSSRKMNKFWYSLFNHLPNPEKFKKNLQPTARDV